ncbi:MAG TPA: NAD-dependent epimerase/dehydratase family protein [Thermoleophilaceae bacterium]|jgi:UDP-glucose 4-epimerase
MTSKRILVTGLSTYWGGRLAQALEQDPDVDVIIGVDPEYPTRELERTEFVRVGTQHALLRRIVEAAEIDTVVDSRLIVDSVTTSSRLAHENNVIGTMNILAACSGPNCKVRKLVFKSSAHFYGTAQDDPAFFTEQMGRPHAPTTAIERDIVDAEAAVAEFAEQNPDTIVSVLRCTNVLGPDVRTSHRELFSLPVVPMILGFDPRYQFVHEDDVVAALEHALSNELPGIYNVAGDGVLALSEVAGLLGKSYVPLLPPWGTGLAASVARRLGFSVPPEMLSQLRFGRGLDNRKFKATGFKYRYTTRETVIKLREHMRLDPILRGVKEPYQYERDVEDFLRWSPHVRREAEVAGPEPQDEVRRQPSAVRRSAPEPPPPAPPGPPVEHYDDLEAEEIISLLGSLEEGDLEALLSYESGTRARDSVTSAISAVLARRATSSTP